MKSKKIRICLLIGAFLACSLLAGCQQSKGGVGYSVSDMIEKDKADKAANLESVIKTDKEAFERQFLNGRYWQQYDELELKLNSEFNKKIEQEMAMPPGKFNSFCRTENVYFKDSLEKLKNGELTMADILANPAKHIWELSFKVYTSDLLTDYNPEEEQIYDRFDTVNNKYRLEGFYRMNNRIVGCSNIMKTKNLMLKMTLIEDPEHFIMNNDQYCGADIATNEGNKSVNGVVSDGIRELRAKYHEDFVWVDIGKNENGSFDNMYAPARNKTLKFIKSYSGDKYLAVLAQRAMYDEIEKIIEEEGYGGKIAHLTIPDPRYTVIDIDPDNNSVDTSKSYTNAEIINKVYKGSFDTILNLLLEPEEEIDYEKMKNISARIQGLITDAYRDFDKERGEDIELAARNSSVLNFYRLPKEYHGIVIDLFQKNWSAGNYFREEGAFEDMWANLSYEREETDGFHFLDIYCETIAPSLIVIGLEKDIDTISVDILKTKTVD